MQSGEVLGQEIAIVDGRVIVLFPADDFGGPVTTDRRTPG